MQMETILTKKMTITITFIRHGPSLTNVSSNPYTKLMYKDPPLVPHAYDMIKSMKKPKNVDRVYASTLLRAIQTARALYPRKRIYVAPHIKEQPVWVPSNQFHTKSRWPKNVVDQAEGLRESSDYKSFLTWLKPRLPHTKKNLNIVVVTHGNFIARYISRAYTLDNLVMIRRTYTNDLKLLHTKLLQPGIPLTRS